MQGLWVHRNQAFCFYRKVDMTVVFFVFVFVFD